MTVIGRATVLSAAAVLALAGCTLPASPTAGPSAAGPSTVPSTPLPSDLAPSAPSSSDLPPSAPATDPAMPSDPGTGAAASGSPTPDGAAGSPSPTPWVPDPVAPSSDGTTTGSGLVPVVTRVRTTDPVVFLTIDDGYTRDPRVVALLRARHVPVTPFLTVDAVRGHAAYFQAVEQATGQSVQDHSITHPHLTRLGLAGQEREICGAADALGLDYGRRPWLFRPPYGDYDRTTRLAAGRCGITALVLWDVSMPHRTLRFAAGDHLRPGDIVLVHWRPGLARDLPVVLDAAAAAGLRVAALQDYLPAP